MWQTQESNRNDRNTVCKSRLCGPLLENAAVRAQEKLANASSRIAA